MTSSTEPEEKMKLPPEPELPDEITTVTPLFTKFKTAESASGASVKNARLILAVVIW